MTSHPQSLHIMDQGDDYSDGSDPESPEEEFPPEPEDSVDGPSASFVQRGPVTHQTAVVRNDKKGKDKDKDKVAEPRKERRTTIKPPANLDPKRYKK